MIAVRLALRYFTATRGRLFVRTLTIMAVASVALSVAATLVASGAMQGFHQHLQTKLLGFQPHVFVQARAEARDAVQVRMVEWGRHAEGAVVPVIEGEVVVQVVGREGYADLGARIRGIEAADLQYFPTAQFAFASALTEDRTQAGTLGARALARDPATGQGGVIPGIEVLYAIGIHPELHDVLRITAPLGLVDPSGNLRPMQREYAVRGFFRSGIFQQDSKLLFMDRREAEQLLGAQSEFGWYVYLHAPERAEVVAASLRAALGADATVQSWQHMNQKLFAALRLEQLVLTILLAVMIGIACVSIFGVVLLQVYQRQRDLCILAALGAPRGVIRRIVLVLGGWIGVIGTGLGFSLALAVQWWVARHPIRLPDTFYLETLPIVWHPGLVASIVVFGVGMAVVAAWVPARHAQRFAPAEGLRSE